MKRYVVALDQGTTSSRCIVFDKEQQVIGMAQKEYTQLYPQPGWVEHDPMEIWDSERRAAAEAIAATARGLGTELNLDKINFETAHMLALVFAIVLTGIAVELAGRGIARAMVKRYA